LCRLAVGAYPRLGQRVFSNWARPQDGAKGWVAYLTLGVET
jgi:hypothetical protein